MNPLKRILTNRRLAKSMKPDPGFREHRLAQFSKERRERYWRNVLGASAPPTALSSLRDGAASRLPPDGLQSTGEGVG